MRHLASRQRGFTLVEMSIVTVVLGVVSALAVPNLLAGKIHANERAVVANLRTIGSASELWRVRTGEYPGATSGDGLADLSGPTRSADPLVDGVLGSGVKGGFSFTYLSTADSWSCVASPLQSSAGFRSFYIDESGLIRVEEDFATNGPASVLNAALD